MGINSIINIYLPSIALFILFIFLVIEWKNDVELRKRMKDMNFFERNYIFPNYFYIYTAIWTITLLMLLIHEPFFYFMFLFCLLFSGGFIHTERKTSQLRSFMYEMYYGTLFVLIIWLINLKLNIISLPD